MRTATVTVLCVVGAGLVALAATASDPPAGQHFGAPLELVELTPLAEVLNDPGAYRDEPILVSGRIAEVCQRKGCWTILQDGDAMVRVRFHDYGFFLPKDCQGEQAWVEGRVQVRTLSEKDARHYEAETRGGDPAKIHGPQHEVGFVATGVRLGAR
jgi:hypothetical protein